MTCYAMGVLSAFGDLAVPKLMAVESATLVVLAASLLVFRTFRERYLLVWIVGWLAYFVSRWTLGSGEAPRAAYLTAFSHGEFVLALSLFAAAVFVYSHQRDLVLPLFLTSLPLLLFSVLQAMIWPNSFGLRVAVEIGYRVIALVAAYHVIRFRWARWEIGSWMLSLG